MEFQTNPYLFWQLSSAIITLILGIYIQSRPIKKRESNTFSVLMFGGAIWSFSNAFQWIVPDLTWQQRWNTITYLGIVIIPTAWFLLAVKFTGYGRDQFEKRECLLWVIPALIYVSILTNPYHHLFFTSFEFQTQAGFVSLQNTYGILFYIHTYYAYILLFFGLVFIGVALFTNPKSYGKQLYGLMIGVLAPFIGNILYLFGSLPDGFPDPTPISFVITGGAFAWSIFGGRLLETVSIAHEEIIQNLANGIVVLDLENRILDINPVAVDILDLPAKDVINQSFLELIKDKPEIQNALRAGLNDNLECKTTLTINENEQEKAYQLKISGIRDQNNGYTGRLLQFRDISRRKQAEANLEIARETTRSILETLQDSYFEADSSGIITYVNQAFLEATRYPNWDDLVGKHFRHVVARMSLRNFFKNFVQIFRTNQAAEPFEFIYRTKDVVELNSEIVASPILKNGEVIGTRGIVRDVSVRVKAEKILREAKEAAEHRAGELTAINRVATIVNRSLDLDEILQSVCVELTKIFPVRNTGIALLKDDQACLEVAAFHAIDPEEESALGLILDLEGNPASQEVIRNKAAVVVPDAKTDSRTKPIQALSVELGSGSFMIVPLVVRGKAIGTIGMPAKDPEHEFTENEVELAETIANQIATAVDNAHLFTQTETALGVAERDLEIGREIQSGFFPAILPEIPGWEIAAHFQAARQVAGDFYDVFQFRHSDLTAFIIADVCDKGVGAALFMVLFRSLLRAFSEAQVDSQNVQGRLKEIVLSTNNFITEFHGQSNMFATMFFGILDPHHGKLFYINAGHEPPILLDKDGQVIQRLMPTGPAVGLFPDMEFNVKDLQMDEGDILIGFTDGATDAKDSQGALFTEEHLLKSIQAPWTSIFSMVFELYTELRNHISGQDQYDDVTLISFRRKLNQDRDFHAICRAATMDKLIELRDFVEAASIRSGLVPDDVFAFKLAAEESLSNIIHYGYPGVEPGYLALAFVCEKEKATLTIWDDGEHFSPDQFDKPDIEVGLEERQIGGLGIHFVKELMDEITYHKDENDNNVFVLEKRLTINHGGKEDHGN
jgi:PAS domain S-box-containing protein